MSDINKIIKTIDDAVNRLGGAAAKKQEPLFRQVLALLKKLDTQGDTILNNLNNLRIINNVKAKIEKLIIDPAYKAELKEFAKAFTGLEGLHNDYFASFNVAFKPKQIQKVLTKNAIQTTINNLTEAGIQAGVTDGLKKILHQNVSNGGSYHDLTEQLRTYMLTDDKSEGALERYVKSYATTAINQFSAEYNKNIADDLNLEWNMYNGSLLETSRDFCIQCVRKKYIHNSEFETILNGQFGDLQIPIYKKTGLPEGLMAGTTPENFPRRRGGWSCGHQLIAVDDVAVPKDVQNKVYQSQAYKVWALKNNKPLNRTA